MKLLAVALVLIQAGCKKPEAVGRKARNDQLTTVAIDRSVRHQTIEGFGGFGSLQVPWRKGPFTSERFIADLEDLGLSILRDEIPTNLEIRNDNDDPRVLDLARFNLHEEHPGHHLPLGTRLPFFRDLKAAIPDVKVIASIWSPPPWMKANRSTSNGTKNEHSSPPYQREPDDETNQLLRENYEELAELLVAYVELMKREADVDVYAVSLQNEPRFSQWYQSCRYDGEALRDLLKVVGQRFDEEGLATRIFVPEDIGHLAAIESFVLPILADPEARRHADILAVHGYAFDGIAPGSRDAQTWRTMYGWGAPYGIPLWMTETSGFAVGLDGAIDLAKAMYNALRFGQVSAWVFWSTSAGNELNPYGLMTTTGVKGKRWYVTKSFYRFIRPGAVRIDAEVDDPSVLALAFEHRKDETATVILVNPYNKDTTVALEGGGLPARWEMYRTSHREDFANVGSLTSRERIPLPARSVSTLTGSFDSMVRLTEP